MRHGKTLEDLEAKTVVLQENRMEACAELTPALNWVVATRLLVTPAVQDVDLDEPDAQVQEAAAAFARGRVESAAKRK